MLLSPRPQHCFATSADFDSATNTPAKKAPIATDNPTIFANRA